MDHQGEISSKNSILKRKRSKLQRPSGVMADGRPDNVVFTTTTTTYSSSSEDRMLLATAEEEEDQEVAKCLILLAQAQYPTDGSRKWWPEKKKVNGGGVYECKTCNRSFHSFQALGGHRTSHKKLKIITTHDETPSLVTQKPVVKSPDMAALQLGSSRGGAVKTRVHECVICGSEFASGQALGGHMRRHRVTNNLAPETPKIGTKAADGISITLSLSTPPAHQEAGNETSRSDHNEFQSLDLNLPAASSSEEDEIGETKFSFAPGQLHQEDSGLGFSVPALVDCHY